ncbi:hypothetical protein GCM10007857_66840 [Bradyrhizobium iriomotense]|uniref:Uncharacterized protein n=1 Tax=Bradyrhizobium iriomotense TaxID=441950 RepID=A0ABQ6B8H5_9BRAD|nr:hypothetical protein GCM10007857_66840 [Bradyrhizobium iriomotense]
MAFLPDRDAFFRLGDTLSRRLRWNNAGTGASVEFLTRLIVMMAEHIANETAASLTVTDISPVVLKA